MDCNLELTTKFCCKWCWNHTLYRGGKHTEASSSCIYFPGHSLCKKLKKFSTSPHYIQPFKDEWSQQRCKYSMFIRWVSIAYNVNMQITRAIFPFYSICRSKIIFFIKTCCIHECVPLFPPISSQQFQTWASPAGGADVGSFHFNKLDKSYIFSWESCWMTVSIKHSKLLCSRCKLTCWYKLAVVYSCVYFAYLCIVWLLW